MRQPVLAGSEKKCFALQGESETEKNRKPAAGKTAGTIRQRGSASQAEKEAGQTKKAAKDGAALSQTKTEDEEN